MSEFVVRAVGHVVSPLQAGPGAPRQPDEGAPSAWIVFEPHVRAAWADLAVGEAITVITWLDSADRTTLVTRPRGDAQRPEVGVFATRSPDRPNPVGLHDVTIVEVGEDRVRVDALEAFDATPVLDVKPVLTAPAQR